MNEFTDNSYQMGDGDMAVGFSHAAGCWVYTCIYGCYGFDYEGSAEAQLAFETHDCPRGK